MPNEAALNGYKIWVTNTFGHYDHLINPCTVLMEPTGNHPGLHDKVRDTWPNHIRRHRWQYLMSWICHHLLQLGYMEARMN
jgi:hypothetical protein